MAVFKTSNGATYINGQQTGDPGGHWQFAGPVNAEAPGNPNDFGLCYDSAGNARAFFNNAIVPATSVRLIDGVTHTMILTWGQNSTSESSQAKFYVDGVLKAQISSDATGGIHQNASRPIRFGRDIEDQRGFKGVLSEVRFYTSIEDALSLHNSLTQNLPTISAIGGQSTNEDTATSAIAFTVGDFETAAGSLSVIATSSNTSVIAASGISLGGSGANRTVTLTPVANASGSSTITVTVTDANNASATTNFALTVNAVNDAPVAAASTLTSIVEDVTDVSNTGTLVSALVTNFTDADSGAVKGIAVTAADATNGTWQYTTDGGVTWLAISTGSTETFTTTTEGWSGGSLYDTGQTWGSILGLFGAGETVSKTYTLSGAATALTFDFLRLDSWDGESFRLTANGVQIINQAFTTATVASTLTGSAGGYTWSMVPGATGAVVAGWPDQKLAVTLNVPAGVTTLALQLSSTLNQADNDESWGIDNFVTPGISTSSARLLRGDDPSTKVRFVPNANFSGTATLTYQAWDQTSGTAGGVAVVTVNGGSTAFSSNTGTATISVTAVNDAPTLTTVSTLTGGTEDTALTISYATLAAAANEADVDGDALSFRIEAVSTGTLTKNSSAVIAGTTLLSSGESLVWTPAAHANGTLNAFTVKAWDGTLASASAVQVQVAVTAVNDAPVNTVPGAQTVAEETALTFTGTNAISVNDVDGNLATTKLTVTQGTLAVTLASPGATISAGANNSATLTLAGTQAQINAALLTLSYQGALNYNGGDTLTVLSTDSSAATDSDTIAITVTAVNDPPTLPINTINASGGELSSFGVYRIHKFTSSGTFTPSGSGTVEVLLVGGGGGGGPSLGGGGGGGGVIVMPAVAVTGGVGYPVVVGSGGASGTNGQASTVFGATAAGGGTSGGHDSGSGTAGGSGGGAASNNNQLNKGGASAGNSLGSNSGTIYGNRGGDMTNTRTGDPTRAAGGGGAGAAAPDTNSNLMGDTGRTGAGSGGVGVLNSILGTDYYWGGGGGGGAYTSQVGGYGGLGGGGGGAANGGTGGAGGGSALNSGMVGGAGSARGGAGGANTGGGGGGGSWANQLGGVGGSGIVVIRYSSGGVNYVDTSANDTFAANTGTLSGTDPDGNTLTYGITGGTVSSGVVTKLGAYGTLTVTANSGALTFTPNASVINALKTNVSETYEVTVSDTSTTTTALYTVSVTGVNDAPTLTTVSTLTGGTEDTALTISYETLAAAANEADVDGDALSFRIEAVSTGTLTKNSVAVTAGTTLLSSGESLVWTPAANANGTLNAFTVKAWDGTVASASAVQVQVAVAAVNDAPTLTTVSTLTGGTEDTALTISYATLAAAANEADVDGDALSFRIEAVSTGTLTKNSSAVIAGTTLLSSGDSLVWTPAANANGTLNAFTVKAWDGTLASASAVQVQVAVAAVNDAPALAAGKVTLAQSASFTVDTNGEVALTETSLVPAGAKVLGVTLNLEYSTYWSWDAVSGCYVRLNGTTFGPLGWTGGGTANNFVAVERKYAGPLPGYKAGSANTWTFGSAWNPTSLRNVTITVYYEATGEPALVLNGTEDTPVSFTAAVFENAFKDVEGSALASVTVVTLPATGTLKLSGVNVTPGQVIAAANLGNLTYEPAANDNGTKTFTVTASDGSLSSAAATVTINLTAVNDAPTLTLGAASASGGTQTSVGGYTVHTFTANGTFTTTGPGVVEVLVVGGGGSGGGSTAGGGGGGGVIYNSAYTITSASAVPVTVGAGGAQVQSRTVGNNGGSSVFGNLTALGGGGGGATSDSSTFDGKSGGSGGGGGQYGGRVAAAGKGTAGQGNDGGLSGSDDYPGGGGGGAGAPGGAPTSSKSGNGGAGLSYAISGSQVFYAGGGGGGSYYNGGSGGSGGGGAGTSNGGAGTPGTANTGGGGGGGWLYASGVGGAGGSGIVIVRYPTNGLNASPSYVDTAAADTFSVATGTLMGADVDANTTLTYGISGGTTASGVVSKVGTYGTLAVTAETGAYTFTPNAVAINALSAATTETFTVSVSDGIATTTTNLVINLTGVNDIPTLVTPAALSYTDTAANDTFSPSSGTLQGADVDAGSTLTYGIANVTAVSGVATKVGTYGTLAVTTSTGAYTFTPNAGAINALAAGASASDVFTVTVTDGVVQSPTQASLTVNVTGASDAPVLGGVTTYISTDFSTLPTNATLYGSAVISNGQCILTPAISFQDGFLIFAPVALSPTVFTAQFSYRAADGNGADGTSFNYGRIIVPPVGNPYGMGEYGVKFSDDTGLSVRLVEFAGERVEVVYNGVVLATAGFPMMGTAYRTVQITVDSLNRLSVSIAGTTVLSNVDLGFGYGSADKANWSFGFASRCGGLNNQHSLDDFFVGVLPAVFQEQVPGAVSNAVTVTDADNGSLASATVTISAGLQSAEDRLGFTNIPASHGNIAGSYNAATGVLTLTSSPTTATLAQWQAALQAVTYTNISDTPTGANRTVRFVVNDGTSASNPLEVQISLLAVNDAPTATAQNVTTKEDTPLAITLNGTDPEGSALTYSVVTGPTKGALSGTAPNLTYTPSANANGADSFTFKVNDGTTDSVTATVSITVTPENDAPKLTVGLSAQGGAKTTAGEYTIHTFTGSSGSFTPAASGLVEVLVVGGGGGGGGSYVGGGGGGGGVLSSTTYAVNAGEPITVLVGAGGKGGVFATQGGNGGSSQFGSLVAVGGGGGGSFGANTGLAGGSGGGAGWQGVAGAGVAGQGVSGGSFGTSPANHGGGGGGAGGTPDSSGVGGVGMASSITGGSSYYAGGGAAGTDHSLRLSGGLGGGGDGGDGASDNRSGLNGAANTGGGGGGGGGHSTAPVGGDGGSGVVIVRYRSNAIDYADTAAKDVFATVTGTLFGADVDSATLTYGISGVTAVNGVATKAGIYGSLAVNTTTGAYTFTPNAAAINALAGGSTASDVFTVTVTDGVVQNPTPATLTLNVTGANDLPTISVINAQSTNEDTPTSAIAFTVGDAETTAGSLTVSATSSNTSVVAASGISLGGSGANRTITLTPAANASGTSTITVTVTDADNASTSVNFALTVTAVDDPPTLATPAALNYTDTVANDTFTGASGTLQGSDVDTPGAALTYGLSGVTPSSGGIATKVGTYGTLTVTTSSGAYTFTPNAAAINALSVSTTESYAVTVSDGTSTATANLVVNLTAANDAPTLALVSAQAAGGTQTNSGGYTIHTFTSDGAFTPNFSGTVEVLVVGGGGGGGSDNGGGGGGGGFVTNASVPVTAGTAITVKVGAGGNGAVNSSSTASNGGDSSFGTTTARGGGGGGSIDNTAGADGGSAGGRAANRGQGAEGPIATTTPAQGNDGGGKNAGGFGGGGGGGGGGAGLNGGSNIGGNGGVGRSSSISGAVTYYAGGGGGGGDSNTAGTGGIGGGGNGSRRGDEVPTQGTDGLGGGGGGAGGSVPGGLGARGGSGIVIVRYLSGALNFVDTEANDTFASLSGTLTATDVDSPTLTYGISGGTTASGVVSKVGTYGTLAVTAATGAYTFTPNAVAINALSASTTESYGVTVSDGTSTATANLVVNLTAVNDAPTIVAIAAQSTNEDTATSAIAFAVGDAETAAGSLTVTATSSNTSIVAASGISLGGSGANRTITLTPVANASGTSTITLTVTDADNASTTTSFALTVTAVNDAPVNTVPGAQTVAEDTALAFSGAAAISVADVDGNLASVGLTVANGTLAVTLGTTGATISAGANNSATLTLAGTAAQLNAALATLTYQGALNFNGADTLTVVATDALGATDTDTVAITVTAVNDAPSNIALSATSIAENNAANATVGTLTASDVDVGATHTFSLMAGTGDTDNGAFNISGNSLRLTSSANFEVKNSYSVRVRATDNGGLTFEKQFTITVTDVNEAPTLAAIAVNGTEDTTLSFTAANFTNAYSDIEGTALASITVVTLPATGTLKLSGAAVNAGQVITAANLANLTYVPAVNEYGARTFTVTASDGVLSSATATVTMTLAAVNDAPVISVGGASAYAEKGPAVPVEPTLQILDADDAQLGGATVTITSANAGDVLGFTPSGGITGSYNAATGVLTLAGVAAVADYQAVLRSVTYTSTSGDPTAAGTKPSRTIEWRVVDVNASGAANGPQSSTGTSEGFRYLTDTPYVLNADGSNPYIIPINLGQNWTFEAEYVLAGNNGFNTLFSYGRYTDGILIRSLRGDSLYLKGYGFGYLDVFGGSSTNGAFVPVKIQFSTAGNTQTLSIYAAGKLVKTISGSTPLDPADKTIRLGSAHHAGNEGFPGQVRNVRISNGAMGANLSTVTITAVNDAPTLTRMNDLSGAVEDSDFTVSHAALVAASDLADVDSSVLSFRVEAVSSGTLTKGGSAVAAGTTLIGPNESLVWRPAANANGTLNAFTVKAWDGTAVSTTAVQVKVVVTAVNDAPVNTVPGAQTVAEDTVLAFSGAAAISVADVDGNLASVGLTVTNGTLAVTLGTTGATISAGANNSATLTLAGTAAQLNAALATLTYQGALNFNGADTLTVVATDGASPALTDTDTVAITVTAVNDAPVNTAPGAQTVAEDTVLAFSGAATISAADVDGNLASVRLSVTNGTLAVTLGTTGATISAGTNNSAALTLAGTQTQLNAALATLTYQGALNFNGSDTLTVVATDALGATDTDTVAITVTAVNDAPVATGSATLAADAEDTVAGSVGTATVLSLFSGNFSDAADTVSGGSAANALAGVAVTSYTEDTAKGIWQYSSDAVNWSPLGSVSGVTAAKTLRGSDRLRFVPAANFNGAAPSLTVVLIDGSATVGTHVTVDVGTRGGTTAFSAATVALGHSVTAVNDAPVVMTSSGNTVATAQTPVAVDPGIMVTDIDSVTLASATVTISSGFQSDQDALGFVNAGAQIHGNISASFNTSTGVLTLVSAQASATLAQWQAALRAVTFSNSSNTPNVANRTITFLVNDGDRSSEVAAKTFVPDYNLPPAFITPPAPVAAMQGSSVFLNAVVSGWPTPALQWRRNGVPIEGATQSVLAIHGVIPSDAGSYDLVASNVVQTVPSVAVALTVNAQPGELFGNGLSEYGSLGDLSGQGGVARLAKQLWVSGGAESLIQIAAAGRHSLILTAGGKVYGMGHNFGSALGIASNAASYPTPELILDNVRQVAAAQDNSYFLRRDGTLWGVGTTQQGMLGEYYPGAGSTVPFPLVPGQTNIVGVWAGGTAGNGGCIYLTRDGQLFLLGGPNVYAPVRLATDVVDAAQGAGFQLWVKTDGSLWAQGGNTFGQLGTGGTTTVALPQKVADGVARVFSGSNFTYFIKRNASLWAMGRNTFGQLGIGSSATFQPTPTFVMDSVHAVACGERHAIILKSDGSVWTAGNNYYGQLGDGTSDERRSPVPMASNAVAVAAGAYYSLHIAPVAPTIITQPEGKALVAGGGATLSVAAVGTPAILYQWKKDGVDVPVGTAAALSLAAVTSAQAGTYVVVVSNGRGMATSAAAVVTVDQTPTAPSIVTHPAGQAVKTGGTATFAVRATGTGTLQYQWRRNEVAVAGATSAIYTLPSVQFAHVGSYDVIVTNSVGSAISAPASLSLIDILPPVITRDPTPVATNPGQRVEFAVEATGTNLRYQWRKDSVEIAGATGKIFTLASALVTDAGAYSVVVSNELGRAISAHALLKVDSVQGAMRIVGSEGLLAGGGTFTLELGVNFIGTAPVQLGWTLVLPPGFSYAGGESEPGVKPVAGNTGSVDWAYLAIPSGSDSFRVRIAYVAGLTGKHAIYGTVTFKNSNLPSSVSPAPVTVFRVDAPVIIRQPVPVFAVSGTSASFSVEAQGGELAYQWFRDGQLIPGATFSTLAFDPVRGTDAGDYRVRVSNAVAAVDSNPAKLTVFEVLAEHGVQGPGYVEGQTVEITNTITYSGGDALMGWQVLLPKGWSLVGSSGDAGDIRPAAGASDLLEWAWTAFPVSPVKFSYILKVPEGTTGRAEIAALLTFVRNGKSGLVLAKPDPLKVERVGWHTADLDRSFTFSLFELLRVIELYNTRRGSVRTGAYQAFQGTEDGFSPDFDRASGVPLPLAVYHSADYGRDGSINLLELLRMIELYNFSANRSRTGQFHRSAGTEDGFAPGPAPAASGGAGVN